MRSTVAGIYTRRRDAHGTVPGDTDLVVTGTGFTGAARRRIRRLAAELGLRYSGDLVLGLTTHLVVANNTQPGGAKHAAARQWRLPVIAEQWLNDSVEAGLLLPFHSYLLTTDAGDACTEATGSTGLHPRTVQDTQGQSLAAHSVLCADRPKLLRNLEKEGWCTQQLFSDNTATICSLDIVTDRPLSSKGCQQSAPPAPHSKSCQPSADKNRIGVPSSAAPAVHSSSHVTSAAAPDVAAGEVHGSQLLQTGQVQRSPARRACNSTSQARLENSVLACETRPAANTLQNGAKNAAAAKNGQHRPLPACPHASSALFGKRFPMQMPQAPPPAMPFDSSLPTPVSTSDPDRQCYAAGSFGSQGPLQQGLALTRCNQPQLHGAHDDAHVTCDQPSFEDACDEPEILRQAVPEEWSCPTGDALRCSLNGSSSGPIATAQTRAAVPIDTLYLPIRTARPPSLSPEAAAVGLLSLQPPMLDFDTAACSRAIPAAAATQAWSAAKHGAGYVQCPQQTAEDLMPTLHNPGVAAPAAGRLLTSASEPSCHINPCCGAAESTSIPSKPPLSVRQGLKHVRPSNEAAPCREQQSTYTAQTTAGSDQPAQGSEQQPTHMPSAQQNGFAQPQQQHTGDAAPFAVQLEAVPHTPAQGGDPGSANPASCPSEHITFRRRRRPLQPSECSTPDRCSSPHPLGCSQQPKSAAAAALEPSLHPSPEENKDNCTMRGSDGSHDDGTRRSSMTTDVEVACPCTSAPAHSSAAAYHGCKRSDLRFFEQLHVTEGVWGATFTFSMTDPMHCALVYYKDLETEEAYAHELAYCRLLSTYQTPDGEVWVEHLYLFDEADLKALPMGRIYLQRNGLSEGELVCGTRVFHSPATVIEEEFWLHPSRSAWLRATAGEDNPGSQHYFCRRAWDMDTGRQVPMPAAMPQSQRTRSQKLPRNR